MIAIAEGTERGLARRKDDSDHRVVRIFTLYGNISMCNSSLGMTLLNSVP